MTHLFWSCCCIRLLSKPASWVKPDKLQDGLLAHEQLHFDICELYARRMRDRFTQSSPGLLTYDSVLKTIFPNPEWQAYQLRQATTTGKQNTA